MNNTNFNSLTTIKNISFDEWFNLFLEEKGLSTLVLDFKEKGNWNYMPINVIVEFLSKVPKKIQDQIKSKLVLIDFKNGDPVNFLEYIARGIIKQKGEWGS